MARLKLDATLNKPRTGTRERRSRGRPGGIANFDDLIAKIRAGQAYANIHTLDHPAGEIRGQIDIRTP